MAQNKVTLLYGLDYIPKKKKNDTWSSQIHQYKTNSDAQKKISQLIDDISQNNTTCNYLDKII